MKLRTALYKYKGRLIIAQENHDDAKHDAMAAHALLQAMDEFYPSNEAARASFDLAKKRAAEILAGWLGEEVAK